MLIDKRIFKNQTRANIIEILHSILNSPLTSKLVVTFTISLVYTSNFRSKRIIRIWIAEKRADAQKNFRNCKSRRPLRT